MALRGFLWYNINTMWILVFQRILLDFILDLLYFPLWWYTGGAKRAIVGCYNLWQDANQYMAPGLWLKNIFVPMFGQRDWQGRLMSFFIRLFNVIFRAICLLIWTGVVAVLFLLWIIFPVFVAFMFLKSLK